MTNIHVDFYYTCVFWTWSPYVTINNLCNCYKLSLSPVSQQWRNSNTHAHIPQCYYHLLKFNLLTNCDAQCALWNTLAAVKISGKISIKVNVKFLHTRYRVLGPELISVYRQSARRWLFKSSPVLGCHYFMPGLQSPSQPKNITSLRPVPRYTAWWQRHVGVNNLPKVVTQLCPSGNWTHNLFTSPTPYHYTIVPISCGNNTGMWQVVI